MKSGLKILGLVLALSFLVGCTVPLAKTEIATGITQEAVAVKSDPVLKKVIVNKETIYVTREVVMIVRQPEKINTIVIDRVISIQEKKITPLAGIALGINGDYPTISNVSPNMNLEVGAKRANSDSSGFVSGALKLLKIDNTSTVNVGASCWIDNLKTKTGLFVEVEKYLSNSLLVNAGVYPFIYDNGARSYGKVFVGGKLLVIE